MSRGAMSANPMRRTHELYECLTATGQGTAPSLQPLLMIPSAHSRFEWIVRSVSGWYYSLVGSSDAITDTMCGGLGHELDPHPGAASCLRRVKVR